MEEITNKIYILYGSATGNGESIAKILEQIVLEECKQEIYCNTLNSIKNNIQDLYKSKLIIIICSTTGNGDPPVNAQLFWNIIKKRSLPKNLLKNVPFIVLGLRDTNYDKFCYMGKAIDKRFEELGGIRNMFLECADESHNFDEIIEEWYTKILFIIKNKN
jgi:methionine synthase reductase